jgi:hypothetical protein
MLHEFKRLLCLCTALCGLGCVQAQEAKGEEASLRVGSWFVAGAPPVDDAQLENMRGGFELPSGLAVSFGVVRRVSVNGELVSRSSFFLPNLAAISADEAKMANDALGQITLVQNGVGNTAALQNPGKNLLAATVVQNSLDNQSIKTLTEINAGANSLGMLRSINTQAALRDALIGAARPY